MQEVVEKWNVRKQEVSELVKRAGEGQEAGLHDNIDLTQPESQEVERSLWGFEAEVSTDQAALVQSTQHRASAESAFVCCCCVLCAVRANCPLMPVVCSHRRWLCLHHTELHKPPGLHRNPRSTAQLQEEGHRFQEGGLPRTGVCG